MPGMVFSVILHSVIAVIFVFWSFFFRSLLFGRYAAQPSLFVKAILFIKWCCAIVFLLYFLILIVLIFALL
jgi:hypothetical protein